MYENIGNRPVIKFTDDPYIDTCPDQFRVYVIDPLRRLFKTIAERLENDMRADPVGYLRYVGELHTPPFPDRKTMRTVLQIAASLKETKSFITLLDHLKKNDPHFKGCLLGTLNTKDGQPELEAIIFHTTNVSEKDMHGWEEMMREVLELKHASTNNKK